MSDRFSVLNKVHTNTILKIREENYRVRTLEMDRKMDASPGQFIMVWVPGIGEKPMSIGNTDPLTISVAKVGDISSKLHELKEGDAVSYRGPFGNPFSLPKKAKRILCIGGGYGVVPMYFLSRRAKEAGLEAYAVIGGRSGKDIIYEDKLNAVCEQVYVTTDDGTRGKKGTVMVEVERLLGAGDRMPDAVYCCGPEMMMFFVAKLCKEHKVPCQVSIERYMKCGTGVCGSCSIDGKLCCKDGPVFDGEQALSFKEFGKTHRDASGKKV